MARTKRNTTRTARTAVIYTRISVDREDQQSIENQERECRAFCEAHGWRVVAVETDKGRSGFKDNGNAKRPALDRAMRMIRSHAADVLVVWHIDRLGRNVRRLLELIEDVRSHDGNFACATLPIDTTSPFGEAVLTILGAVAQLESGIKSERACSWHEGRRKAALPPVGRRPFGYERVDATADAPATLSIVDDEAELIRAAARDVLTGRSLRSIAAEWGMTHRGVRMVLTSPATCGQIELAEGVYDAGNWPGIVTPDEGEQIRAVLLDPSRRLADTNERRRMLGGFAECSCGGRLRSKSHPKGQRYECRQCQRISIRADVLDDHVAQSLLDVVDEAAWSAARKAGLAPAINTDEMAARMRKLTVMYAAGEIDEATLEEARDEQRKAIAAATEEVTELPDVENLHASWPTMTPDQKLLGVSAFVDRVILYAASERAERVEIRWIR